MKECTTHHQPSSPLLRALETCLLSAKNVRTAFVASERKDG
jgi:hypothetical protein